MEDMKPGTIVSNASGDIGVVAQDMMSCCSPDQEPVVYDGSDAFKGTERTELTVIGTYEQTLSDPTKCGMGLGEAACRYIGFTNGQFNCLRFSPMRNAILSRAGDMKAQGKPTHLFPYCQDEMTRNSPTV